MLVSGVVVVEKAFIRLCVRHDFCTAIKQKCGLNVLPYLSDATISISIAGIHQALFSRY
jgi:hypothetical protein